MVTAHLAIADPPYLGRADRWYGRGRGSSGGRHRADQHPDAAVWDQLAAHLELLAQLESFDAWALFCGVNALPQLLPHVPGVIVGAWVVTNAPPSGSRILTAWEPVLFHVPAARRGREGGPSVRSALSCAAPRIGFAGAKPAAVTRWCLEVLGHQPGDEVTDLFPGSGSVAAELAQQRLPLTTQSPASRPSSGTP